MAFGGSDWNYVQIVQEIARHHNPDTVLRILKNSKKYTVLAIAAIIIAFGTGMAVMRLIEKHASKKEICKAMTLAKAMKGGEIDSAL